MKTIIKILLPVLVVAGFWGCNLDKFPEGAIAQGDAIRTMEDVTRVREGNYSAARSVFNANNVVPYDIMADYFNATTGFSNTYGSFSYWTYKSSEDVISDVWTSAYQAIGNINFLLDNIDKAKTSTMSKEELDKIETIKGEVGLLRSMAEHQLLLKFSKPYSKANPDTDWGIPSLRKFDTSVKPRRNTLTQSYKLILEDIENAKKALANVEAKSGYVSIDCVYAFEAQVLLQMGQYAEAAEAALKLINNSKYSLINDQSAFNAMWKDDEGKELIFAFGANKQNGAYGYGSHFMGDAGSNSYFADYIPTQGIVDMYDKADIRKAAYFKQGTAKLGTVKYENVWLFFKYPGNLALVSGSGNSYSHKAKVFRLADMYLIAAEAYAMNNDPINANKMLNTLRRNRIKGYTDQNYAGEGLMKAIKEERMKEMIGEGTRISDLKRWGDGFTRLVEQTAPGSITIPSTRGIEVNADNTMLTWPIPQSEYSANSNIKDQQNEGWN